MDRFLPLILLTVLTNAAAQILMKRGMASIGRFEYRADAASELLLRAAMHPYIIAAVLLMGLSMATYLASLSRFDVSYAMPFMSLGYVIVTIYASMALGEQVTAVRVAGIAVICVGTVIVARS